jgi:hypothetical protein
MAALALSACDSAPPFQGNWSVDIDATIDRAEAAGIPHSAAPRIREIYDGGLLEITKDVLIMRVAGFPDATARNYNLIDVNGDCYRLEITSTPEPHTYCLVKGKLIAQDPSSKIAVVFSRR